MKKIILLILLLAILIIVINYFSYSYISDNIEKIKEKYAEGKIFPEKDFGLIKTKIESLKSFFDLYKIVLFDKSKEEELFKIELKIIELSEKLNEIKKQELMIDFFSPECNDKEQELIKIYDKTLEITTDLKYLINKFLEKEKNEKLNKTIYSIEGIEKTINASKQYLDRSC